MKVSIKNLIQKFTAVVFEKDELELRDMPELKSFLPLLASEHSNSNVEILFWDTYKRTVCFSYKAIQTGTSMDENLIARVEQVKVWIPSYVKTTSTFWQLLSINTPQRGTYSKIF